MDRERAELRVPRRIEARSGLPIAVQLAMRQHRFEEDEETTVFMQREAPALDDLVRTLAPRRRVDDRRLGASDDSISIDEIAQSTFGPWDDATALEKAAHIAQDGHEDELDPTDFPPPFSEADDDEPSLFNRPFFEQAFSKRVFAEGDYEEAAPLPEHEGTMIYVAPPPPSRVVPTMAMSAPPPAHVHAAWAGGAPIHFAPLRPVHPAADPALAPTVLASRSPSKIERLLASPVVAVGFAAVFAAALVLVAFVKLGVPSNPSPVQTRSVAASNAIATVTAPAAAPLPPPVVEAQPAEITAPIAVPVADAKPVEAAAPTPKAIAAPKAIASQASAPQAKPAAPGFQVSFAVRAPAAKDKPKAQPQTKRAAREPSVEDILAKLREEQLKR